MARGLVLGATLISFFTLILCLLASFVPGWLVLRTESGESFCWWGEGIFHSRVWWGSDLPRVRVPCRDPEGLGVMNTWDAYCGSSPAPPLNDLDPANYARDMCSSVNQAKITTTLSVVCALATTVLGSILHFTRLQRRYEYRMVLCAFLSSVCTLVLCLCTTLIMGLSPLFSHEHNQALSKATTYGLPYDGYSCSFLTPLHSVFLLPFPSALKCLFPGPSFAAEILVLIVQPIGSVFLWMVSREILQNSKKLPSAIQATMLSSSPMMISDLVDTTDLGRDGQDDDFDDGFDEFRAQRVYSIYGAMARRFSHLNPLLRWVLITLIPFLVVAGNALTWSGFLLLGLQIIGGARIDLVSPVPKHANSEAAGLLFSVVGGDPQTNGTEANHHLLLTFVRTHLTPLLTDRIPEMHAWMAHESVNDALTSTRKLELFSTIANVFNFSPVLSVAFFWKGGAAFIAVVTVLAMFVVPISKALIWVWYYFAPADELWRGRMLTLVDLTGKYMLAYLFVISIMGLTMNLTRELVFPYWLFAGVLPKDSALVIKNKTGLTWGDGLGSWLFVLSCLFSIIIGQVSVAIHQYAVEWEEIRRSRRDSSAAGYGSPPPPGSSSTGISSSRGRTNSSTARAAQPSSFRESPWMLSMDTPFLGGSSFHHQQQQQPQQQLQPLLLPRRSSLDPTQLTPLQGVAVAAPPPSRMPQQQQRRNGPSVMQAIQSFGNLQELGEDASSSSNVMTTHQRQVAARKPVMQAIVRYGSRTALAALDETDGAEHAASASNALHHQQQLNNHHESTVHLGRPMHPLVEAMCDRVHQPVHGVRLRWTPFGKGVIFFILFLLAGLTIICQMIPVFRVSQRGFTGDFVVEPRNRVVDYSIMTLANDILSAGWSAKPYEFSFMLFFTLSFMPMIRLLGIAYLWVLPFTISQQKRMFDVMEISAAWSSLEVFLISVLGNVLESMPISKHLTGMMTPNLAILVKILFNEDGLVEGDMMLLPGFYLILFAVILEKIISYLIIQQAVTAIAERQAERMLRTLARAPGSNSNYDVWEDRVSHIIEDGTQGLMQTRAAYFFSPAGRYWVAPQRLYAGLPRSVWARTFVRLGLLADADLVGHFGSPSSQDGSATPAENLLGGGPVLDDGFTLENHHHHHVNNNTTNPMPSSSSSFPAIRAHPPSPPSPLPPPTTSSETTTRPLLPESANSNDDWPMMF